MTILRIEKVVRETEKAILVSTLVSYSCNAAKPRDIWFPKSQVAEIHDNCISVNDWFVSQVEYKNAFKGYVMHFAYKTQVED